MRLLQIGDLAVLDISATTIDQDEANVKNIPSAESKGLPISTSSSVLLTMALFFWFGVMKYYCRRISQLYFLSEGYHFDTEDGDKVVPGFLESIIGIQRGETKSFPLVFPESWTQEELQGVHAQFNVSGFLFCGSPFGILCPQKTK